MFNTQNAIAGPYDFGVQDRIETLSLVASFCTLVGGIFFHMLHEQARTQAAGRNADSAFFMSKLSLEVLVAGANVAVLLFALRVVAREQLARLGQHPLCDLSQHLANVFPGFFYFRPRYPAAGHHPGC